MCHFIFSIAFGADPKGTGEGDSIFESSIVLSAPVLGEVFRSCTVAAVVVVVVVAILDQGYTQLTS